MKAKSSSKFKQTSALLGILVLLAVVTILPSAFAQVAYTDADNPSGPLQGSAWAAGMATAGVMSGIGIWSAVKRR